MHSCGSVAILNQSLFQSQGRCCVMKHKVRVDPQVELPLVRFKGRVDLDSLFDVLQSLPEKGFEPGYKILWDAQEVRQAVIAPGDLERLMEHYAELVDADNGHVREAAIVERPLDYSLAELYRELARRRSYDVAVCWKPEEALDYLGIEELHESFRNV